MGFGWAGRVSFFLSGVHCRYASEVFPLTAMNDQCAYSMSILQYAFYCIFITLSSPAFQVRGQLIITLSFFAFLLGQQNKNRQTIPRVKIKWGAIDQRQYPQRQGIGSTLLNPGFPAFRLANRKPRISPVVAFTVRLFN